MKALLVLAALVPAAMVVAFVAKLVAVLAGVRL